MPELAKRYDPKNVEEKWYSFWESRGYFTAKVRPGESPYVIVIPPPNITGILTMGHVLNNTLQDILIRWKRMQGYEALWLPGTDHAGIATQNVVEKELAKEGVRRQDIGRKAFLKKVWDWREQYGGTIIRQLKRLGCSCDWSRERFTMDEGLSHAVREVFVRLYEKGLIYRGNYIINWCPRCHTAVSDEEVEHEEHNGHLWHIRYPVKGGGRHVTVATTRPETMLGDTAIAVHPGDERYKNLVGEKVIVPIVEREIPVIADNAVDPAFGTGIVKVTPAHDPNDFLIGLRHSLAQVVVMDGNAVMNENAGSDYRGMDRFECREALVKHLEDLKLIEKIEKHAHAVGHCYRCQTVIEPYLSEQWFVKMKPLAEPALKAVLDKKIRFYPPRWIKVYQNWMENIRDWCISRQLWWGHRIPVWYCGDCRQQSTVHSPQSIAAAMDRGPSTIDRSGPSTVGRSKGVIVSREKPLECPVCGSQDIEQDEDVLDTWFSSWLWPFSTLGWPEETADLGYFYPTATLVTGPDIIFFWVARMIMAGIEFMGEVPFRDVFFTGIIRDREGRKMSKSLGNSPDPLDVIGQYGADALRFTIARLSPVGQDVYYSNEQCELGRNFANKIWNASRFLLMNIGDSGTRADWRAGSLSSDDRYILSKLNQTVTGVTDALAAYRFNEAAESLYEFFWSDYCDWYIESVKPLLQRGEDEHAKRSRSILLHCLETFLRLLSPLMPFLSEEIWQMLPTSPGEERGESVTKAPWPDSDGALVDPALVEKVQRKFEMIRAVRNLRKEHNVPLGAEVAVAVKPATAEEASILEEGREVCLRLMKAREMRIDPHFIPERAMPTAPISSGTIVYMYLEKNVDVATEGKRLRGEIEEIDRGIEGAERELNNREFLRKAPEKVIEMRKRKKEQLLERRAKVQNSLDQLLGK
ncbi:MAG: valine--tRNA ligase [Candidatus Aureabacteria bacterium]|nr:valine--tRNA ligase [Candidatus Auribacterota bacterium]